MALGAKKINNYSADHGEVRQNLQRRRNKTNIVGTEELGPNDRLTILKPVVVRQNLSVPSTVHFPRE